MRVPDYIRPWQGQHSPLLPTYKLKDVIETRDKKWLLDQWTTMFLVNPVNDLPLRKLISSHGEPRVELHETSPTKGKMTPRQCLARFKECVKSLRSSPGEVRCAFFRLVWTDKARYADTMEGEDKNVHKNDLLIYCHARDEWLELYDQAFMPNFMSVLNQASFYYPRNWKGPRLHQRMNRFNYKNMVDDIDFPNGLHNGGVLSLESILVKVAGVSRNKAAVIVKAMNGGSSKM